MKLFYFDVETTGLSAAKCAIHQLAAIVEVDGEIKEKFNINIKPFEGAMINDKSLSIGCVTKECISNYEVDYKQAYNSLKALLETYVDKYDKKDKFFLVGYNNASFDNHFFRALWLKNNDKYFASLFHSVPFDCFILSGYRLRNDFAEFGNFKLASTCKLLGIHVDDNKLHDAMYDVELTRELYLKL
jgi:DNA polymerase-3 subunit epsilon